MAFLECRLASADFGIMGVLYEIENWAFLFDLEPLPRGKTISPMVPGKDADHRSSISSIGPIGEGFARLYP